MAKCDLIGSLFLEVGVFLDAFGRLKDCVGVFLAVSRVGLGVWDNAVVSGWSWVLQGCLGCCVRVCLVVLGVCFVCYGALLLGLSPKWKRLGSYSSPPVCARGGGYNISFALGTPNRLKTCIDTSTKLKARNAELVQTPLNAVPAAIEVPCTGRLRYTHVTRGGDPHFPGIPVTRFKPPRLGGPCFLGRLFSRVFGLPDLFTPWVGKSGAIRLGLVWFLMQLATVLHSYGPSPINAATL